MSEPEPGTFHWSEIRDRLTPLAEKERFEFHPGRGVFEGITSPVAIHPPAVVGLPPLLIQRADTASETAQEFARRVRERESRNDLDLFLRWAPRELPLQAVILLQAGAASIAMTRAGEPLATKSFKRYVTRGKGKAQPTFLAKKGKSRYGARLRLQNAARMIEETNERLGRYWKEHGVPEQTFVSAPARHWAELFQGATSPPFGREHPITRIPFDVPVPTTEVLLRTYRAMGYGRISRRP